MLFVIFSTLTTYVYQKYFISKHKYPRNIPRFEKPVRGNWVNHVSDVMLISSELLHTRSTTLA